MDLVEYTFFYALLPFVVCFFIGILYLNYKNNAKKSKKQYEIDVKENSEFFPDEKDIEFFHPTKLDDKIFDEYAKKEFSKPEHYNTVYDRDLMIGFAVFYHYKKQLENIQ